MRTAINVSNKIEKSVHLLILFFIIMCNGVFAQGMPYVDSVKNLINQEKDQQVIVDHYNKLGIHYKNQADSSKVASYCNKAIALGKEINYGNGVCLAYDVLAWLNLTKGNYAITEDLLMEAIQTTNEEESHKGYSFIYNTLGVLAIYRGDFESVITNLERAVRYSELLNDDIGMAKTLINLGSYTSSRGEYAIATNYLYQAIKYLEDTNRYGELGAAYGNLGEIYYRQEILAPALDYTLRSLEFRMLSNKVKSIAHANMNIGLIMIKLERFTESIAFLKTSLKNFTELGDRKNMGWTHYHLAESLTFLDNLDQSRKNVLISKALFEEIGDVEGLILTHNLLASYYQQTDASSMALYHLDSAIFLNENSESFKKVHQPYLSRGILFRDQMAYNKAINDLEMALEIAKNRNSLREITRISSELSQAYEGRMEYQKAFKTILLSKTITDSLNDLSDIRKATLLEADYLFKVELDSVQNARDNELALIEKEVEKKDFIQRLTLVILILIFIILIITYYSFRIRHKKNMELKLVNANLTSANELIKTKNQELEQAIKELDTTQKTLLQTEKMASLGVLASGVGHEINNPLNFIKKGVELIERKLQRVNTDQKYLQKDFSIVNDGINRITKIVSGLRGYSRQDDDYNQHCDMSEILENCVEIVQSSHHDRIQFIKEYQEIGIIRGNEGKLHQVFLNILMNAAQSILEKGTIEIRISHEDELLHVQIKDSGSGISETIFERIGEPFLTSKPPGEGTGLGLFISFDIIKQHQGSWEINSTVNKGTIFSIYFPILGK